MIAEETAGWASTRPSARPTVPAPTASDSRSPVLPSVLVRILVDSPSGATGPTVQGVGAVAMPAPHEFALDVIRSWPDVAREAAYRVLLGHGAPDQLADGSLRWDGLGPWKRVVVCATDDDDDPDDVVESVIEATIPDTRRAAVDEVADEFHVAIEVDGEISVRGPDLKANALTLNIVHDIVVDGLAPERARERRALELAELRRGHAPADVDELHLVDDAPHGEPSTIRSHTDHRPVDGTRHDELGNSS
jgi:hypothetical protein